MTRAGGVPFIAGLGLVREIENFLLTILIGLRRTGSLLFLRCIEEPVTLTLEVIALTHDVLARRGQGVRNG